MEKARESLTNGYTIMLCIMTWEILTKMMILLGRYWVGRRDLIQGGVERAVRPCEQVKKLFNLS